MNLLMRILLIAGATVLGQIYLPWFIIVFVPFLIEAILGRGDSTKFFSGFYGVAIPWMALAGYIDFKSESILSVRILEMFSLPRYGFVMVIITGLLGGLMGGLSSLVGGWLREAIKNE